MRTLVIAREGDNPWYPFAQSVVHELNRWASARGAGADAITLSQDLPCTEDPTTPSSKECCIIVHPSAVARFTSPREASPNQKAIPARYLVLVSGGSPPFSDPFSNWARQNDLHRVIEHGPDYRASGNFVCWYSFWHAHGFSEQAFMESATHLRRGVASATQAALHIQLVLHLIGSAITHEHKNVLLTQKIRANTTRILDLLDPMFKALDEYLIGHEDLQQRLVAAAAIKVGSSKSDKNVSGVLKAAIRRELFGNHPTGPDQASDLAFGAVAAALAPMESALHAYVAETQGR